MGLVEMGRRKVEERRIREVIVEDWEGRLEDVSLLFLISQRRDWLLMRVRTRRG